MSQFTTVRLANQRVLVRGKDTTGAEGETVLSSRQWDDVKAQTQVSTATAEFDAAVEAFFKPLTDAADKLLEQREAEQDPASFVVIGDEIEHVQGQVAHVVTLDRDSQVLRLIEEGQSDRLIWVAGDLEVTEYQAPNVVPAPVEADVTADA